MMQTMESTTSHQNDQVVSDVSNMAPSERSVSTSQGTLEALWTKAVNQLNDEDKQQINVSNPDKRGLIEDVISVVEEKHQLCVERQWTITRDSEPAPTRDPFGRIIVWINKFRDVGTIMMQYDPVHAAIPWATIRFVLEGVMNDSHTFEAIAGGLEYVSSLIVRYAMIEAFYLQDPSVARQHLTDAIVRLYTAILAYLCKARRYYGQNTTDRFFMSFVQPSEIGIDAYLSKITAEERRVDSLARLVDVECLRSTTTFMGEGFAGLNDKIEVLTDRIEEFRMDIGAHNPYTPVSQEQILDWLDPIFTTHEYDSALSARSEGTCEWMFQRHEFQYWMTVIPESDTTNFLWINGPPGFGKTVLCATLINHLRREIEGPVSYFFCNFEAEHPQGPETILRSWVAQLLKHNHDRYLQAVKRFRAKNAGAASESELWTLLQDLSLAINSCYFIIDGFEECTGGGKRLMSDTTTDQRVLFLQRLVTSLAHSRSHVLIVSRDSLEMRDQFAKGWQISTPLGGSNSSQHMILRDAENPEPVSFFHYNITCEDTKHDIMAFTNKMIIERLPNKSDLLQKELADQASERSNGMFLWIRLLEGQLSPEKNTKQLKVLVCDAPAGLDQAYKRDMKRILELSNKVKERAISTLRWVAFAHRPLTVGELTVALLVDIDDSAGEFPVSDLPDAWDEYHAFDYICKPCGSLLALHVENPGEGGVDIARLTVQFVHPSVRAFLLKCSEPDSPFFGSFHFLNLAHANDLLARTCLSYLCYRNFYLDYHFSPEDVMAMSERYAFLNYAVGYWYLHLASEGTRSQRVVDATNHFFDSSTSRWIFWSDCILHQKPDSLSFMNVAQHWSSPLHPASAFGLTETVGFLLKQGVHVDSVSEWEGSALNLAALHGHLPVVKLLLANGATRDLIGNRCGAALHNAILGSEWETSKCILQTLLDSGANIELQTIQTQETPLHFAVKTGSIELVECLLEKGANIQAKDSSRRTSLDTACRLGNQDLIKSLIEFGADVGTLFGESNAVYQAAHKKHRGILRLLIDREVESGIKDTEQTVALLYASQRGHRRSVRGLLQSGVKIDKTDCDGSTALLMAIKHDKQSVARLLLEQNACTEFYDICTRTALHYAAIHGNDAMLILLLDYGANIEAMDKNGFTPLALATLYRQVSSVKLLRGRNANVLAVSKDGYSVLHYAAAGGDVDIVEFLLDQKADLKATSNDGFSVLHCAVVGTRRCRTKTKMSLRFSSLISPWGRCYYDGSETHDPNLDAESLAVLRLLISRGADPYFRTWRDETLLHFAVGSLQIVSFLIDVGLEVDAVDIEGRTPLHNAAELGFAPVVNRLLDAGSDPNKATLIGETALHTAVFRGSQGPSDNRLNIIQTLLKHGADPYKFDLYGRRCVGWASRLSTSPNLTPLLLVDSKANADYVVADDTDVSNRLHASITTAVETLQDLETRPLLTDKLLLMNKWLQWLGQMLALSNNPEAAGTAFLQAILEAPYKISAINSGFECSCDRSKDLRKAEFYISGPLVGCCSCLTVFSRSFCMDNLAYKGRHKEHDTGFCGGHQSLMLPRNERYTLPKGIVNSKGESRAQWLGRLHGFYSRKQPYDEGMDSDQNLKDLSPPPARHGLLNSYEGGQSRQWKSRFQTLITQLPISVHVMNAFLFVLAISWYYVRRILWLAETLGAIMGIACYLSSRATWRRSESRHRT